MKKAAYVLALAIVVGGVSIFFGSADARAKVAGFFSSDPDAPPWAGENFDEAGYLARREAFVNLLRGIDPERPSDPMARTKAIVQADKQRDRILAADEKASAPTKVNATALNLRSLGPARQPSADSETTAG